MKIIEDIKYDLKNGTYRNKVVLNFLISAACIYGMLHIGLFNQETSKYLIIIPVAILLLQAYYLIHKTKVYIHEQIEDNNFFHAQNSNNRFENLDKLIKAKFEKLEEKIVNVGNNIQIEVEPADSISHDDLRFSSLS